MRLDISCINVLITTCRYLHVVINIFLISKTMKYMGSLFGKYLLNQLSRIYY
nr:MAG TPA: hypothetical protein [Bacteriophage sp.]